jgi:hypothetical protein
MPNIESIQKNVTSIYGEDGILSHIFDSLDNQCKYFINLVDYRQRQSHNPLIHLINERGFVSCISGCSRNVSALRKETREGVENVIGTIKKPVDFLYVNNSHNYFWVLKVCMEALKKRDMRPIVVCVPFNSSIPLKEAYTVPWKPRAKGSGSYSGCSLMALSYVLPNYTLFGISHNKVCYFVDSRFSGGLGSFTSTAFSFIDEWETIKTKFWVRVRPHGG